MKRLSGYILALVATLLLAGCGGGGSSASPPADVKAVAGDGVVTLTWTMEPGVQYWVFSAAANSVTTDNWSSLPSPKAVVPAVSPQVVTGLVNGTTYSFTINGRTDGGPGGPGSPSVSAVPRLAGAIWNTGANLGTADLRGVTAGAVGSPLVSYFIVTGTNGTLFSSTNGSSWTGLASGVSSDLNAATYGGSIYLVAGAGGVVLRSTDAVTWTPQTSGVTQALYGLSSNGGGVFVAVGAQGTIVISGDGVSWGVPTSGTTADLYSVTYGNGRYVAVGAGGTVLTSGDGGATWQAVASQTSADLKGVAYGAVPGAAGAAAVPTFVAVGAAGTLITSPDGVTWTAQSPIASNITLNAVTYGTQFVAVGSGGGVFTSWDGYGWQAQNSGTVANLNAVAPGLYGYAAVGAAGTNISAF